MRTYSRFEMGRVEEQELQIHDLSIDSDGYMGGIDGRRSAGKSRAF
jgi:hypothetical protein